MRSRISRLVFSLNEELKEISWLLYSGNRIQRNLALKLFQIILTNAIRFLAN